MLADVDIVIDFLVLQEGSKVPGELFLPQVYVYI